MAFAFFDAPHAAALTILVLAVLATVAAIQFLFIDRRTHYQ
jgi:sn-glycerol 3-phosphate transport system permease protein